MNTRILANLIFIPLYCSSAALASQFTAPLDIFGVEVGNTYTSEGTDLEGSYTSESVVTSIDPSTFPTTTYIIEVNGNGETDRAWYETTPGEIKLWGIQEVATGEFISFSAGLVEAWFPMQAGDQRYSYATAEMNLYPGIFLNTSLTADVLTKEAVALGFDTLEAFKVLYQLRVWGYGEDETETFYQWVVPYLGVVQAQDAEGLDKLTSFAIGGGTITKDTDTDGDGLKDYQELIVYNTNRIDSDTDHDGYSDYREIRDGSDPLDKNSVPFCPGDFTNDGDVDGDDLSAFLPGSIGLNLEELATDFGRTDCPGN